MKGFRTLIFNGGIVVLTALLTFLSGIDWKQYVDPTVALVIVAIVNFGLRFITTTPVATDKPKE